MQKIKIINGIKYYVFECRCGLLYSTKVFKKKLGEWVEEKMSNKICNRCMNNFVEVMENE